MGGAAAPRTGDSPAGPSTDYKGGAPLVQGSPLFRPPAKLKTNRPYWAHILDYINQPILGKQFML